MNVSRWPLVWGACAALFAGCAVGPDYHRPQVDMTSTYQAHLASTNPAPAGELDRWWELFHDPALDRLIREAARSNYDIRIAQARVREARAQAGVARAALLPSVDASGDYTHQRLSRNAPAGFVAGAAGLSLEQNSYDAGVDASWEADVFGGNRRAFEAARADLGASVESSRDVLITVLGDVGVNYLDLRGLQKELAVVRQNLQLQEDTLGLTRGQLNAGLATEVDTARAEAQAENTRAQIPLFEQNIQRDIHRLAILTGRQPGAVEAQLSPSAPIPMAVPSIPVGLPSDLLRRRPDIRETERELAAATARIGVATADLFPKFTLTSMAGLDTISAGTFFDASSSVWSIGPSMRWSVFAGGRIRQNIKVQNARQEQALDQYQQTVLTSLEEVENALVACNKELEHHQALVRSEAANRRAAVLAEDRYRSGLEDFLDVLDTQRSLLAVQDDLAQSERTMGQNIVRLYKALGGGWNSASELSAADNEKQPGLP